MLFDEYDAWIHYIPERVSADDIKAIVSVLEVKCQHYTADYGDRSDAAGFMAALSVFPVPLHPLGRQSQDVIVMLAAGWGPWYTNGYAENYHIAGKGTSELLGAIAELLDENVSIRLVVTINRSIDLRHSADICGTRGL